MGRRVDFVAFLSASEDAEERGQIFFGEALKVSGNHLIQILQRLMITLFRKSRQSA